MKIAVLDDDLTQSDLICQVLTSAGHACYPFKSTNETAVQLRRESYAMLTIGWRVADLSGLGLLRSAREKLPSALPILFIVNHADEDDIVAGLGTSASASADDYIIKPLRRSELLTRVQVLLRRAYPGQHQTGQIRFGHYIFVSRTGKLFVEGKEIVVTQKEFDLALLFFRNLERPLSRAFILEAVWGGETELPSRTLDTHVSRVRNKLQLRPENGFRLSPVYSYGYQLEQLT